MKKFTILMIAMLVAAMSFAQVQMAYKVAPGKEYKAPKANTTENVVRNTRDNVTIFSEGFEFTSGELENGWTSVDQDGDGNDWFVYSATGAAHSGTLSIASASWQSGQGALTPNNWLISPAIDLSAQTGTIKASYFIKGQDPSWPNEHYKVCASTTTNTADFVTLFEETIPQSDWIERTVDLSAYAGGPVYLAFVHFNISDMFYIVLDDLTVYVDESTDAAITEITAPTHGDYSTCALTNAEEIKINILNNGGAAISNFEVSYSINGGAAVTETVTASVAPAQTYEYTFAQTADLSTVGTYNITASVNLTGDETTNNNNATLAITNGDGTIRIHAFTDNMGGQSWTVTNTLSSTIVAERTNGWQWNIEVNEYVCVDASACYTVVVSDEDEDGMVDGAAYLEILYNGTQVAGSTTPDSFTGATLVAERLGNGCSTDPEIVTDDDDLEFYTILGTPSDAEIAVIRAFNLTEGITATTAAPFEVSADNTTFAATATIAANGGNLYVRYNPTEAGTHTGTVVLSSTGAENVTIDVEGESIDCSTVHAAPFEETFAATSETIACWTIIDANNDSNSFNFTYTDDEETDLIGYYFYSEDNNANDWLISPKLSITANNEVAIDVAERSATYPESYKVWAITESPANYANATLLRDASEPNGVYPNMETIVISLAEYAGQEIYIGIQCVSNADTYMFLVDNFELRFATAAEENIAETIAVYPNPTNSMVTIANAEGKDIVVINSLGQVVASIENAAANQTIDVTNFANGTYFVKVDAEVVKLNVVK